ncbi:MAG: hypothetical protein Q9209_007434 [Squamulea sp. 1 TL-2023]
MSFDEQYADILRTWQSWGPLGDVPVQSPQRATIVCQQLEYLGSSGAQRSRPYRPMIHLEPQLSSPEWDWVWNSDRPIVQYFNECDKNYISPERAAQAWRDQMVPLRQQKGKKLVGPAVSSNENGKNWLAGFMNRVSDQPPDFLGLHYYGTDGNDAIRYLEEMHSKYPQSIVVSEIASIDRNIGSVYNFTVQLANYMDNADWIFEYGFFGCMRNLADGFVSPDAQLMQSDGHFTNLMVKLQNEQLMVPP